MIGPVSGPPGAARVSSFAENDPAWKPVCEMLSVLSTLLRVVPQQGVCGRLELEQPLGDLPVLPQSVPELVGLCSGALVLPSGAQEAPPLREGVHELGGGFVVGALGLFQRLAWSVGEGVEGVPEALKDRSLSVDGSSGSGPGARRSAEPPVGPAGCWARVWSYIIGCRFRSARRRSWSFRRPFSGFGDPVDPASASQSLVAATLFSGSGMACAVPPVNVRRRSVSTRCQRRGNAIRPLIQTGAVVMDGIRTGAEAAVTLRNTRKADRPDYSRQ